MTISASEAASGSIVPWIHPVLPLFFYKVELSFRTVTSAFSNKNSNSKENLGKNNKAGLENQEISNIRREGLLICKE